MSNNRKPLELSQPIDSYGEELQEFKSHLGDTDMQSEQNYTKLIKYLENFFPESDWIAPGNWANEVMNRCVKNNEKQNETLVKIIAIDNLEKRIKKLKEYMGGISKNVKNGSNREHRYAEKTWTNFQIGKNTPFPEFASKVFLLSKKTKIKNESKSKFVETINFTEVTHLSITLFGAVKSNFTFSIYALSSDSLKIENVNDISKADIIFDYPNCSFEVTDNITHNPGAVLQKTKNGNGVIKKVEIKEKAEKFGEKMNLVIVNHPSNKSKKIAGKIVCRFELPERTFTSTDLSSEDSENNQSNSFIENYPSTEENPEENLIEEESLKVKNMNVKDFANAEDVELAKAEMVRLGLTEDEVNYRIDRDYNRLPKKKLDEKYPKINATRLEDKLADMLAEKDLFNKNIKSIDELERKLPFKKAIKKKHRQRLWKKFQKWLMKR